MPFHSLNIINPILKSLFEEGYEIPTPIQREAIPIILKGSDLLGCAQTGTGKTAAFTIPVLQLLSENRTYDKKPKIRSLIVTPTRELAIQINDSINTYGKYTHLKSAVIYGGVNQNPQTAIVKQGVDILVATPGRLLDLISQGYISLRNLEIFVLDEADCMLDMGFIHDIRRIISLIPKKRQSLFFSATMPPEIIKLANTILNNPSKVEITPSATPVELINQLVYFVDKENKSKLLLEILKDEKIKSALVFTRTKHGADNVVKMLGKNNIKAEAIHGNKSQNARQRALANFKELQIRVLVATDIASRGIDIDDMEFVINYEISNISDTYVHRIGRTGRAGAMGTAISFCDAEEKAFLADIEKLIGKKIPVNEKHPFPLLNHNPVKSEKQNRKSSSQNNSKKKGSVNKLDSNTKNRNKPNLILRAK